MLDGVGDVDFLAIDAGFFQRFVEDLSCRSDKRLAGQVLLVAGLLADQHDAALAAAFAADRLGCALPQRTTTAVRDPLIELLE
jgi:hypothetical protein